MDTTLEAIFNNLSPQDRARVLSGIIGDVSARFSEPVQPSPPVHGHVHDCNWMYFASTGAVDPGHKKRVRVFPDEVDFKFTTEKVRETRSRVIDIEAVVVSRRVNRA